MKAAGNASRSGCKAASVLGITSAKIKTTNVKTNVPAAAAAAPKKEAGGAKKQPAAGAVVKKDAGKKGETKLALQFKKSEAGAARNVQIR